MCLIVLTAVAAPRRGSGSVAPPGESMFVDLRERISRQTRPRPTCPTGWHVESALESAGGTAFAGDFLVATRPDARPARDRPRGRLRQGRGRRRPRPAARRGVRGAARGPAARRRSCRRPTTTCSARTGTRASPPPSTCRSTCAPAATRCARPATRPPPCARPAPALDGAADRGPDPRPDARRDVHLLRPASCGATTRSCSTPTAWSSCRAATSTWASTGCWGRPSR